VDRVRLKTGIDQHTHLDRTANDLGGKRQLLLGQGVQGGQYAGNVPSRPGMACHQSEANRIGDIRGDDRDGRCGLSRRDRQLSVARYYDVGLEPNHLVDKHCPARQIAICIAIHNVDVAARYIAKLLHALRKSSHNR
jgi:hypothetical protein